jgi:hypothetical protein
MTSNAGVEEVTDCGWMEVTDMVSNLKEFLDVQFSASSASYDESDLRDASSVLAMTLQLRVYVPPHPLIKHWLGVARDTATPSVLFRSAMTELGRWLTYEAVRDWLATEDIMVQTPWLPALLL